VFQLWLPDVEVLNLKMFQTLDVLSKLQGLWVSQHNNLVRFHGKKFEKLVAWFSGIVSACHRGDWSYGL
jgi:hypothetical protein